MEEFAVNTLLCMRLVNGAGIAVDFIQQAWQEAKAMETTIMVENFMCWVMAVLAQSAINE